MKKHLKISALVLGAVLMLAATITTTTQVFAAADPYKLLAPLPCNSSLTTGTSVTCSGGQATSLDIKDYVQYTFNLLIALAAVAAVFMIVWGGLEYMTTDAIQGKKSGLDKLRNAVYGLLLVLCSYLILKTIDPRFVQIPNGLVPKLVLNTSTATVGGLGDVSGAGNISDDPYAAPFAAASTKEAAANTAAAVASGDKLSNLEALRTKLGASADTSYADLVEQAQQEEADDPEGAAEEDITSTLDNIVAATVNQNAAIVDKIVAQTGTDMVGEISSFNSAMVANGISASTLFGNNGAVNKELAKIDQMAKDENSRAQQYSNTSSVQGINEQAAFAKANVELDAVNSVINNNSGSKGMFTDLTWTQASFTKTANDYISAAQTMQQSSITDKGLQAQLQTKIDAVKAAVANMNK